MEKNSSHCKWEAVIFPCLTYTFHISEMNTQILVWGNAQLRPFTVWGKVVQCEVYTREQVGLGPKTDVWALLAASLLSK